LLSTSSIASSLFNNFAKFVQFLASKSQKSSIAFGSFDGKSLSNHISSAAQIIQLLSTHLIEVFFIVIVSVPCHETVAHILATATFCDNFKFEPPHTI
jgi:hypothetical protein